MTIQSSGPIKLQDIEDEFGGSNPTSITEYYGVASGVPTSGNIGLTDFYGTSKPAALTFNVQQIVASDYITAGGTLTIPTGVYVWSDDTSVAALTVDVTNATIINNGYIIGKGGDGGLYQGQAGSAGGPAISITASGVTVTNSSGAYIAGGGGGGGGARRFSGQWSGGGGGAGGGRGGATATIPNTTYAGGAIGQKGTSYYGAAGAAEAGGHGSYDDESSSGTDNGGGSGGGGRILPGVRQDHARSTLGYGGAGGEQGGPGRVAGNNNLGGGGGGWGAAGGNATYTGGAAGAAITGSGSFTNAGTIFGPNSASYTVALTNEGTINGRENRKQIVASSFISSGQTLRIPAGFWVWSDDIAVAALTVDIPCTIENLGNIIGKGGAGGTKSGTGTTTVAPENGGPAISVTSAGVTIVNGSSAYIAGGGGGGHGNTGSGNQDNSPFGCSGGGGAGGGIGGGSTGGSGGVIGQSGGDGASDSSRDQPHAPGRGGGAGGGGGGSLSATSGSDRATGGGGGRILPGVGGQGCYISSYGASGGSAGNVGGTGTTSAHASGGGGWGAAGGGGGGTGGAAISGTVVSLTDDGTIYGAT